MSAAREIQGLVNSLGQDKSDFLHSEERSVDNHIRQKSFRECLTFVERTNSGAAAALHSPEASTEYLTALKRFCAGETLNGRTLDSGLTDGVVSCINSEFQVFYDDRSDQISAALVAIVTQDRLFLESLTEQLLEFAGSDVTKYVRGQAMALLLQNLEQIFDTGISQTAAHTVHTVATKAVAASVSAPIAQQAAAIIVKFLTLHFKTLIAAALKSAAVKSIVAAFVKKFAAGAILAAIVKIVGTKFTLGSMAAFLWVLLPALAAYLAYEAHSLPAKLGDKVSARIRSELDGSFEKMNHEILNSALNSILTEGAGAMASNIAAQPQAREALDALISEVRRLQNS